EIRNQISVMLSRHPWLDIGLQERKKNRSMALYWLARTKVTLCHSELDSESQIKTQKRDAETSSA
ncbi:MAG: hypothetical protein II039_12450, partial [Treponema sp.]|nr:hypothetical protein [Treponema sp.]